MDTLQFIDAMAGRLAWPVSAVVLGLLFRHALIGLIGRMRHFSIGYFEAELTAETEVQEAVRDAAQHHIETWGELNTEQKRRIGRVIQQAVNLGFTYGQTPGRPSPPTMIVEWPGPLPRVRVKRTPGEQHFLRHAMTRIENRLSGTDRDTGRAD